MESSSGTIVQVIHDRRYFIAEDDWSGGEVFGHFSEIIDAVRTNNHTCLYQITAPVLYTISGIGRNRRGKSISLDPQYKLDLQLWKNPFLSRGKAVTASYADPANADSLSTRTSSRLRTSSGLSDVLYGTESETTEQNASQRTQNWLIRVPFQRFRTFGRSSERMGPD